VIARADARQPGADNQHIDMFIWYGGYHRPLNFAAVMAGLRPAIPPWLIDSKDVDARHKAEHDEKYIVSFGMAISPHPEKREARLEG
jgi:hypothetical protein